MTTLYLAWQHPPTRRWFPVGRLVRHQSPNLSEFAYVQGAKEADNLAGFRPIPEFPSLERRYRASELFPTFRNRVMNASRIDRGLYLNHLGLHEGSCDELAELAVSGGRIYSDSFETFPAIEPDAEGRFRTRLMLHGLRRTNPHAIGAIETLRAGGELRVAAELNNPVTTHAILVYTQDYSVLGWLPRYVAEAIHRGCEWNVSDARVAVAQVNRNAPLNNRLLLEFSGRLPPGVNPMLGVCRIWHTVSDKIRARPGECREFTMSDPFKPVDRDTPYLLPPSLQDWLPQEHLARFVVEIVDRLDLTELERAYGGRGKTPYHPAVMVALLFYGYATGVFSSRKLELATYDSVAFRYITADTHPDHDTIAHFRKRFLEPLRGLFVQILVIAQAMGVLKIGTVSLDGTKVKANASKHKAMSWGYANRLEAQLREEVKTLLEQAARADTEASPGLDIPEELERREARLAAIERAKAEIERRALKRYEAEQAEYEEKLKRRRDTEKATGKKARGREPKAPEPGPRAKDQVNFTDEESRIMPSSEGFVQGYNAQAAVDIDSHVIVAEHVSDHTNDKQELAPALRCLDERQEVVGQPRALLADAGYFSDENVKRCEAEGIEPYIASGRERHHRPLADRLAPVPERPAQADGVAAMGHRMKTPEGRALYAKRKSTVETVFGVIKEVMGFRRFHLRGLEAVQGEWALVCMAWNLKRMHVAVA